MSANTERSNGLPTFSSGLLIARGSLIGAGALIALAGLVVGGSHVASATRQWIREMEVPPSELARIKWGRPGPPRPPAPLPGRTASPLTIQLGRDGPAACRIARASPVGGPPDQGV